MAEPVNVSSVNKCSNTPAYRDQYLGKLADKVLANSDVQYYLEEAKKGNTFITIDGMLALTSVKVLKGVRKQFEKILLGKIKDPAKRVALKPKRIKLTKADIFFITAPNLKLASEQLAIQGALSQVKQLAKRGKYASLLAIVKKSIKPLGDKIKLLRAVAAIHVLGVAKYRVAVPWLIKVVKLAKDSRLRRGAIIALGKIGDKRATHALLKVADSVNELVLTQKIALAALARIGDKRSIPTLIKI